MNCTIDFRGSDGLSLPSLLLSRLLETQGSTRRLWKAHRPRDRAGRHVSVRVHTALLARKRGKNTVPPMKAVCALCCEPKARRVQNALVCVRCRFAVSKKRKATVASEETAGPAKVPRLSVGAASAPRVMARCTKEESTFTRNLMWNEARHERTNVTEAIMRRAMERRLGEERMAVNLTTSLFQKVSRIASRLKKQAAGP